MSICPTPSLSRFLTALTRRIEPSAPCLQWHEALRVEKPDVLEGVDDLLVEAQIRRPGVLAGLPSSGLPAVGDGGHVDQEGRPELLRMLPREPADLRVVGQRRRHVHDLEALKARHRRPPGWPATPCAEALRCAARRPCPDRLDRP